jgi:hypothetical protein
MGDSLRNCPIQPRNNSRPEFTVSSFKHGTRYGPSLCDMDPGQFHRPWIGHGFTVYSALGPPRFATGDEAPLLLRSGIPGLHFVPGTSALAASADLDPAIDVVVASTTFALRPASPTASIGPALIPRLARSATN